MEGLTYKIKPKGLWTDGFTRYYALNAVPLCDDVGEPIPGFGWLVVEMSPLNMDVMDVDYDIYDVPLFAVGGAFIENANLPEIEVLNRDFTDEGGDADPPKDVIDFLNVSLK